MSENYYVSYTFVKKIGNFGFENLTTNIPPTNGNNITAIQEYVKETDDEIKNVVVLNWCKFEQMVNDKEE